MIKTFTLALLFVIANKNGLAQNKYTDSLLHQLAGVKNDTSRVLIMSDLCYFHRYTNIDSSMFYGNKAVALAQQIKFLRGEADALNKLGLSWREKGDLPKSLELQFKALKIAQDNKYILELANVYRRIGHVYRDLNDLPEAVSYSWKALENDLRIGNQRGEATEYMNLGISYALMKKPDSALYYAQKAYDRTSVIEDLKAELFRILGDIEVLKGNKNSAVAWYWEGVQYGLKINDFRTISYIFSNMATMYQQMNQPDSSIICAINGVKYGQLASYKKGVYFSGTILSQLYDSINPREALRYYKIAADAKDSLFGAGNIKTIRTLVSQEEARQKEIELAKAAYQNRLKQYGLLGGLGVFLIIAAILFRNNRQKQKTNRVLETTLSNLKSAQAQLIQSEKMASLGELTAGIAHEIQNPLNFVNNFSELNKELLVEMKDELDKGNTDDAKAIANDLIDNEEKINHHGKRADAIVKGMLQHSRTGSGQKELTDVNVLADEYLRLAYHGLRAKDMSFNANFKTDLDNSIEKINIIPQDIGRVILNLLTNAFYAVNEKNAQLQGQAYEPTVAVSTRKTNGKVEIKVRDNGNGIPQKALDKIFQPFFTTKPTGQGTGLGLSMSYDIVTKGHGGELKVETSEGAGTTFTVILPITP
jgi:two-component system, NtrC family, sensor kinase